MGLEPYQFGPTKRIMKNHRKGAVDSEGKHLSD